MSTVAERPLPQAPALFVWSRAIFLLGLRLWLAWVFFSSGLTKIMSWESTLALFEYEYAVPLVSPPMAAWTATSIELIVPISLALGVFARPSAAILLGFNAVAMLSYPDISPAGIKDHLLWQLGFLVVLVFGGGRFRMKIRSGKRWLRALT